MLVKFVGEVEPPHIIGLFLYPRPPIAPEIANGKSGRFLQIVVGDSRSRTSMLSVIPVVAVPTATSSFVKPFLLMKGHILVNTLILLVFILELIYIVNFCIIYTNLCLRDIPQTLAKSP